MLFHIKDLSEDGHLNYRSKELRRLLDTVGPETAVIISPRRIRPKNVKPFPFVWGNWQARKISQSCFKNLKHDQLVLHTVPELLHLISRRGGYAVADIGHAQKELKEPLDPKYILRYSKSIKCATHNSCMFGLSSAWLDESGATATRPIRRP